MAGIICRQWSVSSRAGGGTDSENTEVIRFARPNQPEARFEVTAGSRSDQVWSAFKLRFFNALTRPSGSYLILFMAGRASGRKNWEFRPEGRCTVMRRHCRACILDKSVLFMLGLMEK